MRIRERAALRMGLEGIALLVAVALVSAACDPRVGPKPFPPTVTPEPTAPDKEDIDPEGATGYREIAPSPAAGHYMVSAANPHAAAAGAAMLAEGGSAIDAAVAIASMLSLVEPQSSGIGGGAFLLHFDATNGEVIAYDGREVAPAAATEDMFLDAQKKPMGFYDAVVGGLSVGVPGELRMLEQAHQKHGKLPWKRLFKPAIELAEKGFEVTPRLHMLMGYDRFSKHIPPAKDYLYQPDGTPKPVGTVLKNPELAEVLREVAEQGADAFYKGQIAKDIVAAVKGAKQPGRLSEADLAAYKVAERDAVCAPFRAYEVCGMPPPSSGGVAALQILSLVERHNPKQYPHDAPDVAHLLAEAGRLAYADRDVYMADADFVDVPTAALVSQAYMDERAKLIDLESSMGKAEAGRPGGVAGHYDVGVSPELPSTTHFVAVDATGNAISMTASVENLFGSRIMVRGFFLNNQLTDFSFKPRDDDGALVANRVEPGKRPRSSMAPLLAFERDPRQFVLAIGSPGGSRIIGYVARVTLDVLEFGLPIQEAVNRPHVVNRNGPTELEDQPKFQAWIDSTKAALEKRGHEVKVQPLNSGIHAILRRGKEYTGAADPRREGQVIGD